MLSQKFDSVFSPVQAEFAKPIANRGLIPIDRVNQAQEAIEDRFAELITGLVETEAFNFVKKLKTAIKQKDQEAIRKARWNVKNQLQLLLWGLWNESWNLGIQHGFEEVQLVRRQKFSAVVGLAEFKREKKTVQPGDGGPSVRLQDNAINRAVTDRTVSLASDVNESTQNEIKGHLLAATDPKNPISEKELENRIRYSIGRQQYREQVDAGTIPTRKAQKAAERGLAARARKIAKTELSAAYSVARLQAYLAMGIQSVRWQFNEVPRSCQVCRSRAGSVHRIQDLIGAAAFRLRRFEVDPARQNEWGYDPSQYVIPAHPYCGCFWIPVPESQAGLTPKNDPRKRKPVPVAANWLKAGVLGLTGVYAMLALANRVGGAGARQAVSRLAQELTEIGGQVAPVLEAAIVMPNPQVFVGRFDINETSVIQLRSRFKLTDQQAINLATSIQNRRLTSLQDLIDRINRGEIPGINQATLENNILSKLINNSISINNPGSQAGLIEQLRSIGIDSKTGTKIWNELQSERGQFESVDSMIERLAANQGTTLNQKQQDLLRHYTQTLPTGTTGVGSTQTVQFPGSATDLGMPSIRPGLPQTPGQPTGGAEAQSTARVPQALVRINQSMIAQTYRLSNLSQQAGQADRSLQALERTIDDFGLVLETPRFNPETNQLDDIGFRIKPAAADRYPNGQPSAEDREAIGRIKEQYIRYANQAKALNLQRNILMADLRDLRRQYNDIAQQAGFPQQFNAQFQQVTQLAAFVLESISKTHESSFLTKEKVMRSANFARPRGARDKAPRRRRGLLKLAGTAATVGGLLGAGYLVKRSGVLRGAQTLAKEAAPPAAPASSVLRISEAQGNPFLDPDVEKLLNENPKKLMNKVMVNQRKQALRDADPQLMGNIKRKKRKVDRSKRKVLGNKVADLARKLRGQGSYFMMCDVSTRF